MTSRNPTFFRRRRRTGAAILALSLLPLAACTGGGAAPGATAAPQSASATASASAAAPTPTPSYKPADAAGRAQNVPVPVLPEAARAETKEGLEAFAKYWFQQLNFAYETGDVSRLAPVTSSDCKFCSNIINSLTANYASDRWLAGGKIETPSISTTFQADASGHQQVVVQVQQAEISYFESGGTEFRPATLPSDTGNVMLISFRSGVWQLVDLHPIR